MLDDVARKVMQSHVKASLKKIPKVVTETKPKAVIKSPLVKEVTGGELALKEFVDKSPNVIAVRNEKLQVKNLQVGNPCHLNFVKKSCNNWAK